MIYFARGTTSTTFSPEDVRNALFSSFDQLGERRRVLAVPPDFTRFHSQAGTLTELTWEYYRDRLTDVLPALGTHRPMTHDEISAMFGKVPKKLFRVHDWRDGLALLGEVPAKVIVDVSEGRLDYGIPLHVDRVLAEGAHDLIVSFGQVVPHEVLGMAGHNKNIFVGAGGHEGINKTHFLAAVFGMEKIMGRIDTPVRRVFNYGSDHFARHLPIVYVLTVLGRDDRGRLVLRGLFIGDDAECFERAAALSCQVNIQSLDRPLSKIVVYLDPAEFKTTWLGNKSIYRTRMALADGGELIILAPGIEAFGEDEFVDRLIRRYGYSGTPNILTLVRSHEDLQENLSAAAHLIQGSSENRFQITCCPGRLSRPEIEQVGFNYADLGQMTARYDPGRLSDGFNVMPDGEEIYFISNPAVGLWAHKARFSSSMSLPVCERKEI